MEQPQPTGELTPPDLLTPFARRLLGVPVFGLWRLVTMSSDGSIPLLGTMIVETDAGFVPLSYTQAGLSCRGPMRRQEIRWDTEPDLPMGKTGDAEEWLNLEPLEDQTNMPALPFATDVVTGWFGVGSYVDTFALILAGEGRELVIMTTDEFDLQCATPQTARHRAELVAANMNLNLVEQQQRRR